jgi:primary-amine oxidase
LSGNVLVSPATLCMSRSVRSLQSALFCPMLTFSTDEDDQFHPAGRHVPQTSGEPSKGLPEWIAANPTVNIANEDIVIWHTFGITHFPSPEDYPVMPAEPMTLLLRPRNFFLRNPALDVPPSYSRTPSEVAANKAGCNCADKKSVQV